MQERRANKAVLTVIGVMVSCAMFPAPAYAADAENWASLEGWLNTINGKLGLIYAEAQYLEDIYAELPYSQWTSQRVTQVINNLANSASYLNTINYNVSDIADYLYDGSFNDMILDAAAIAEATEGTALLVDNMYDVVENIDTNAALITTNQASFARNLNQKWNTTFGMTDSSTSSILATMNNYLSNIDLNTSDAADILDLNVRPDLNRIRTILNSVFYSDYLKVYDSRVNNSLSDIYELLESGTISVDTGLTIPSLSGIQTSLNTISSGLIDVYSRIGTGNTTLSSLLTAWNAWKNAGYTVDTGLTIPSLSGIQNSLNTISSSLTDVYSRIGTGNTTLSSLLTAWNAWKNAGYTVDTGLTIPDLTTITNYLSNQPSIYARIGSLLNYFNAWHQTGWRVDTGLSIPSLSNVEQSLDYIVEALYDNNDISVINKLNSILSYWTSWANGGYRVNTGLEFPSLPAFDDSRILLGISSLGESVDAIYHWLILSNTVDEVIGDFDFGEVAENASLLMDNASQLAPFVGFELMAVMLQIWSATGVHEPNLDMQFNFMPGSNEMVTIDLSWLTDAQPLFNMMCISMLLLCLINSSVRIIEQEATA